ncbi:hypothetical protein ACYX7E_10890 [Luteimonas sp. RIT-PG2_3]
MDFLKILKSFEEFVYEALTWIILLPKTLLRTLLAPRGMTAYASGQLSRTDDARFAEALSPPLTLILCVLIAHVVDLGIRTQAPDTSGSIASEILASEQNLLLYRTIAFGVWALAGATYALLRTGTAITRDSLRGPFYEQCYLVAPFALVLSLGTSMTLGGDDDRELIGACMVMAGFVWFWIVQFDWIGRRAGLSRWRSAVAASCIVVAGSLVNGLVGHALSSTRGERAPDAAVVGSPAPAAATMEARPVDR